MFNHLLLLLGCSMLIVLPINGSEATKAELVKREWQFCEHTSDCPGENAICAEGPKVCGTVSGMGPRPDRLQFCEHTSECPWEHAACVNGPKICGTGWFPPYPKARRAVRAKPAPKQAPKQQRYPCKQAKQQCSSDGGICVYFGTELKCVYDMGK